MSLLISGYWNDNQSIQYKFKGDSVKFHDLICLNIVILL